MLEDFCRWHSLMVFLLLKIENDCHLFQFLIYFLNLLCIWECFGFFGWILIDC